MGRVGLTCLLATLAGAVTVAASELPRTKQRLATIAVDGGGFLPELQGVQRLGLKDSHLSDRDLMRLAYAELEGRLRAAGHDISIEVDMPRTIYEREFAGIRLGDVFTQSAPGRLQIVPFEMWFNGEPLGVTYRLSWVRGPIDRTGVLDDDRPLAEFASLAEGSRGEDILAATSARVRVSFDGNEVEYQALMTWTRDTRGDGLATFRRWDEVITDLGIVLESTMPIVPESARAEAFEAARALAGSASSPEKSSCRQWARNYPHPKSGTGSAEHLWGSHAMSVVLRARCTCDQSCFAQCEFSIDQPICTDSGVSQVGGTPAFHRMAQKLVSQDGSSADGGSSPPKCVGAFACFAKSCGTPNCSDVQITAQISGSGVRFATSGEEMWSFEPSVNMECGSCLAGPPFPSGEPFHQNENAVPPGGGGGGTGGGSCSTLSQCYPVFYANQVFEYCDAVLVCS